MVLKKWVYFLAHFIDCRLFFFYSFFSSRSLIHTLSIAVTRKKHKYKSTEGWSDVLSFPSILISGHLRSVYLLRKATLVILCCNFFLLTLSEIRSSTIYYIELNSRRSWFISSIDIHVNDNIILLYISNWYTILCIRSYINCNLNWNTCINCNLYKTNNQTWSNHHSETTNLKKRV